MTREQAAHALGKLDALGAGAHLTLGMGDVDIRLDNAGGVYRWRAGRVVTVVERPKALERLEQYRDVVLPHASYSQAHQEPQERASDA